MDTITEGTAAESDTERLLSRWEEARRNMTPEEQRTADEAAIRGLYEKYMKHAGDESLSPEHREKWANAVLDLEDKYPDLFNDYRSSLLIHAHISVDSQSNRRYPRSLQRGYCCGCSECGGL